MIIHKITHYNDVRLLVIRLKKELQLKTPDDKFNCIRNLEDMVINKSGELWVYKDGFSPLGISIVKYHPNYTEVHIFTKPSRYAWISFARQLFIEHKDRNQYRIEVWTHNSRVARVISRYGFIREGILLRGDRVIQILAHNPGYSWGRFSKLDKEGKDENIGTSDVSYQC